MHTYIPYTEMMRSAGYRMTRQRQIVLDALCSEGKHVSLKRIALRANKRDPRLNLSTVYRVLKVFIDVGIVVSGFSSEGERVYEIAHPQAHHHLVCNQCGHDQEVGPEWLDLLFRLMCKQYGFEVHMDHLILQGRCKICRAGEN